MLHACFVHEMQESSVSISLALSFVNIGEDAVTKDHPLGCTIIPEPIPEGFLSRGLWDMSICAPCFLLI